MMFSSSEAHIKEPTTMRSLPLLAYGHTSERPRDGGSNGLFHRVGFRHWLKPTLTFPSPHLHWGPPNCQHTGCGPSPASGLGAEHGHPLETGHLRDAPQRGGHSRRARRAASVDRMKMCATEHKMVLSLDGKGGVGRREGEDGGEEALGPVAYTYKALPLPTPTHSTPQGEPGEWVGCWGVVVVFE